jgi:DNA polymerase III delta prime subunit
VKSRFRQCYELTNDRTQESTRLDFQDSEFLEKEADIKKLLKEISIDKGEESEEDKSEEIAQRKEAYRQRLTQLTPAERKAHKEQKDRAVIAWTQGNRHHEVLQSPTMLFDDAYLNLQAENGVWINRKYTVKSDGT